MIPFKKHTFIAFAFFIAAVSLGLLLRYSVASGMELNYRYFVHAHSHVAVMGWIYFGMMALIGHYFLKPNIPKKTYNRIFYFTLLSVVGMLFSFPFQGYAFFSILFSSLFLIASYWFSWAFFKYAPNVLKKQNASYRILKYAVIYLIISSIGPWAIGVVMATLGPDPFWYNTTIYFYLHFQYNAWIIMGILAILFNILEKNGIFIPQEKLKLFLRFFNGGILLTFFISILFSFPPHEFYVLSIFGACLQIIAFFMLHHFFRMKKKEIARIFEELPLKMLKWTWKLFFLKLIMQLLGSFPAWAEIVTYNHNLAIGFLHWVFLGIASIALFALLAKTQLIRINSFVFKTYFIGFLFTELLIFYKPAVRIFHLPMLPQYDWLLFIASALLVVSIVIVPFISIYSPKTPERESL